MHRLFVYGEDKAAGFAEDFVAAAWGVDTEGSGGDEAVLVALAAGEDEDVLVAFVPVTGNAGGFLIAQKRG